MAAEVSDPSFAEGPRPAKRVLDVLILYEDFSTALRANRLLAVPGSPLSAGAQVHTKVWRLDLLADAMLREQAAIEAAAADVVILSVHGQVELPAPARECLNRWLHYHRNPACRLALLVDSVPSSREGEHSVLPFLQRIAKAADVHLFFSSDDFHPCPDLGDQPPPSRPKATL